MTAEGAGLHGGPRLLAGTYARNGGQGIHALIRDDGGSWALDGIVADAANASFGTYAAQHKLYYLVDEEGGALNVFGVTEQGWQRRARVATAGQQPCYVALNADQTCLAIANYGSGSVGFFQLSEETGLPLEPPTLHQHDGSGPVAGRQDGPHAHCVCFSPDQRWLYHVDLGTDEIVAYPFDREVRALGERRIAYSAPKGSGPRHLVLHPRLPLALLVSELASTLTVLEVGDGAFALRQTLSTLPSDFSGDSLGGHLSLNAIGDRAYVTNRGHDSIAVFAWDENGSLELLQHISSEGASPRAFALLEAADQLVLANEEGGNIVFFTVHDDGTLSRADADIPVPGAVFLLLAEPPGRSSIPPAD